MPELPDLTVIRRFLLDCAVGVPIVSAEVRRPIPVRNLLGGELSDHLVGRSIADVRRRGKFLLLSLDDGLTLAVNPMLAGRIRCGQPLAKHRKRDVLVIGFENGRELRYHDAKDMGKVYLVDDLDRIPGYSEQGPEANADEVTLEVFQQRLKKHRGEIKGVLVNQRFLAGIGNAYADEILWRAGIYPFRRRPSLDEGEIATLYEATRDVLAEAVGTLEGRMTRSDQEVRDFLAVHGKPGEPCPRCGSAVSEVKRERRATHFCRTCQPGLMVTRGKR